MRKIAVATTLGLSILLVGCNQSDDQSSNKESTEHHTDSNKQSQNSNKDKKLANDEQSNNKSSNQNKGQSQQSQQDGSGKQKDTTSTEYYAKVWLTGLSDYRNGKEPFDNMELQHSNISGEAINPLLPEHSAKYPDGTQILHGTPSAAGHVIYKNNGDGTITMYEVPSHFQDLRWSEADYSEKETNNIINNAKTVKLYDASESEIAQVKKYFQGGQTTDSDQSTNSDTDSEDSSTSKSDSHQSGKKITRSNVIDAVEDYEGHLLDTDKYTYKEPEQMGDGKWGFSYTDKNGNLAGSYIIDSDGNVTKYDEHGDKI